MSLKQITRIVFPYVVLLAIVFGAALAWYWQDPLAWLQEILAIGGYYFSLTVYTVLLTTATVFAPITIAVTIPFMAKIFGATSIFIATWISWMIGSMVAYWVSRTYGRPVAGRLFSLKRIEKLERRLPKHLDFWVMLLVRVCIPVDALSYAAGLKREVSFATYLGATALGIIPFAFILSYGPDALAGENPWLLFGFFAVLLVIIASFAIFYLSSVMRSKVTIYTHDGKFHTDDVFAVAVIEMILDQQQRRYEVVRTRDPQVLAQAQEQARKSDDVFIVDVGNVYDEIHNMFDHHQEEGAGVRENSIEYAAFGLVWKRYGIRLCDNKQEVVDMVDQLFVQAIDGSDNGQNLYNLSELKVSPITLFEIIERYYLQSEVSDNLGQDSDFYDAVVWAKSLLPKVISQAHKGVSKQEQAGQIYAQAEDKRIMISDTYVGRNYFVRFEDVLLAVSPRANDTEAEWGIAVIPVEEHSVKGRVMFPEAWWGLREEELQEASGVRGAKFCHRSGDFICVAYSKKSALELAHKTLEQYQVQEKDAEQV